MSLPKSKITRITLMALFAIAAAALLTRAAIEVSRGNGAGVYANAYGMQIHWVTVLTLAASFLIAFLVALPMRWWQRRDDRMMARLLDRAKDDWRRQESRRP